jgi:NTE family protein
MRDTLNWPSAVLALVLALALGLPVLVGCDTLKTRHEVESTPAANQNVKRDTKPQNTVSSFTPLPGAQTNPPVTTPAQTTTLPGQPQTQAAPTFLNKELPKVGVILGPGGMKAFAHIGVLREMARARIPVHAMVGMEWGAVIGGLYSMQGQANDAEWKSFKLRDSDLPGEGLLSGRLKPISITHLNEFLETAFANASVEKSKVEFACPAYWMKLDRLGWMAKGLFKDAMRVCVPYPPFYVDNGGVFAAPFSVDEAAAWLRSRGANVIVLVNVLAQGESFPASMVGDQPVENLLWSEIRREMVRARPSVNYVISVNTTGHPITDFSGRRALMESGAKAATDIVNKMVSEYGF